MHGLRQLGLAALFIIFITPFLLFSRFSVSPVSAAYCSGTVKCGSYSWLCSSTQDTSGCDRAGASCDLGRGTCSWSCNLNLNPQNTCDNQTQTSCTSITAADCASGCSTSAENPCSWVTSGTPPPSGGGGGGSTCDCNSATCRASSCLESERGLGQGTCGCSASYYACVPASNCVSPVNGSCSTTHYNCSRGTSYSNQEWADKWTWVCGGTDGGSNASCSETKACTITSTPTCNAAGTQISTVWNVVSKNFTINQIEGRFNKTPYNDWPTGPGDQSLNWGAATSGSNTANITGNTDYSTSVAVYDVAPNAARDNFICRSTITNPNCPVPACVISSFTANPSTISVGEQSALASIFSPTGGTISSVAFSSGSPANVTVSPLVDNTPANGFTTFATGVSPGSSVITATATMSDGGVTTCNGTVTVDVASSGPWWQVKDGDVSTNGNLESTIPPTLYFDTKGPGGYPGIPAYKGTTNLTISNVSEQEWLANSGYTSTKIFNSAYFLNAIPAGTTINNLSSSVDQASINTGSINSSDNVYYFEYTPVAGVDLSIGDINNDINIGNKKVVLIAKSSDVYLNGEITLTNGTGFFLLVAGADDLGNKGNIIVNPSVGGGPNANLKGIYVADAMFKTGTNSPSNDSQLRVLGTVAAYGGFSLQRDLGNSGSVTNANTPAEFFQFAPELELLFPSSLAYRRLSWQEVAP